MGLSAAGGHLSRKIGILGGMFDPVHNGHLKAALAACKILDLDETRLMPCARPVHRGEAVASDADRLAMLGVAIADKEALKIDARECERDVPSWTVHSLEAIRQELPAATLYLIMGTDTFGTLETWHRWQDLFSLSHLVLVQRPGFVPEFSPVLTQILDQYGVSEPEQMKEKASGLVFTGLSSATELSSTAVRTALENAEALKNTESRQQEPRQKEPRQKEPRQKEPLQQMLPAAVLEYIETHGLYTE